MGSRRAVFISLAAAAVLIVTLAVVFVAQDGTQEAELVLDLAPGESGMIEVDLHCGAATHSRLIDGSVWQSAEADSPQWVPLSWRLAADGSDVVVAAGELDADGTTLRITLNEREVVYERGGESFSKAEQCA